MAGIPAAVQEYNHSMTGIRPQELLIILVILLVLFGGAKLPQLARNLGKAQKEFRDGLTDGKESDAAAEEGDSSR